MLRDILGNPKEFTKITKWLFDYYFHRISQAQFEKYVGNRTLALQLKSDSKKSGYLLKNCKLYAYACYAARKRNLPLPKAKSYQVTERDARFLRRLNLSHLNINKYRVFTLKEFDHVIAQLVTRTDMQQHVGKLVSKKLIFLVRHYGVPREELNNDLYESTINAMYRAYPLYENYLHFTNIAKANIHNEAMSIIKYHTAKSRDQLQQTTERGVAHAFESVNVDIANLVDIAAPESYGSRFKESLQALSKLEPRMSATLRSFILILAGHYDLGFSEYLKMPNDVLVEEISYEKYMKKAMQYFKVTEDQVQNVFSRMNKAIMHNNTKDYIEHQAEADKRRYTLL